MFEADALWKKRLRHTGKELGKYFRYIFNGHLVLVLIFLIGAGAYYYQAWVETMDPDFPVPLVMAFLLALIVTHSPIYTLLKPADRIFLLPLEDKLGPYFFRAVLLSFFISLYWLIIGLAVLMPMYVNYSTGNFSVFFSFLAILAVLKLVNFLIRWQIQYYVETIIHRVDSVIRFLVNGVFLYLLFDGASYWLLLPFVFIYALLYYLYFHQTMEKGLKWDYLIGQQGRRMMVFYRFANMFTDVPGLEYNVKRRKWLDWLERFIPFKQENVYTYLFLNTFLRGGDYFGLFVRLTIVGAIGIYLLPALYGKLLFVVLFLFLTGFQLVPLWKHHQNKILFNLYPVGEETKRSSFKILLFCLLAVQSLLLATAVLIGGNLLTAAAALGGGLLFSCLFVFFYINNKLRI